MTWGDYISAFEERIASGGKLPPDDYMKGRERTETETYFLDHFWELRTCAPTGMGIAAIPGDKIMEWGERIGYPFLQDFLCLMRYADRSWIETLDKQRKSNG